MPRTKGSKNRPKTTHIDYASQIAEKQESIASLTSEIASITVSASKHGVVQNCSFPAIIPTSLFEAFFCKRLITWRSDLPRYS